MADYYFRVGKKLLEQMNAILENLRCLQVVMYISLNGLVQYPNLNHIDLIRPLNEIHVLHHSHYTKHFQQMLHCQYLSTSPVTRDLDAVAQIDQFYFASKAKIL